MKKLNQLINEVVEIYHKVREERIKRETNQNAALPSELKYRRRWTDDKKSKIND